MNELEEFKKEVDDKLHKMSLKQIREHEESKKKSLPYDKVLQIKEKELKNVMSLIEIYKRDKESLEKTLNEKSDYKQIVVLQNKLKEEENKTSQLENEIKVYNRLKEEHNKCEQIKNELVEEKNRMMTEMKYIRSKNRELQIKIKDEEEKISKLNDVIASTKTNILLKSKNENTDPIKNTINTANNPVINLANINSAGSNTQDKPRSLEKSNTIINNNTLPIINTSNPSLIKNSNQIPASNNNLNQNIPNNNESIFETRPKRKKKDDTRKLKSKERLKFSKSLQNKHFGLLAINAERPALFPKEEKEYISKILPKDQLEKIQKRFNAIDQSKLVLEKKYLTETKGLTKKLLDVQERLDLANIQGKEAEQKNKILSYQINEHKNENSILKRKINEFNKNLKNSNKILGEKEKEIKQLTLKIQELLNNKTDNGNNNSRSYHEKPDLNEDDSKQDDSDGNYDDQDEMDYQDEDD